jgi:hypothetical protein
VGSFSLAVEIDCGIWEKATLSFSAPTVTATKDPLVGSFSLAVEIDCHRHFFQAYSSERRTLRMKKLFKPGWWKIKPHGSGLASGAFGVMDEIFHAEADTAHHIREEQKREVIQKGVDESEPIRIVIERNKKAAQN